MLAAGAQALQRTLRSCRAHSSFTEIPVIDVAALTQAGSSQEHLRRVADQLHRACSSVGFFYVQNHGAHQCNSEYCSAQYLQSDATLALSPAATTSKTSHSCIPFAGVPEAVSRGVRDEAREWFESPVRLMLRLASMCWYANVRTV